MLKTSVTNQVNECQQCQDEKSERRSYHKNMLPAINFNAMMKIVGGDSHANA